MVSVMDKANMCHRHEHVVFISGFNDVVIANGTAALGDVRNAALVGAFDIVAKREESVGAKCDFCCCLEPSRFFFRQEYRRFFCENALPFVAFKEIFIFIGKIDIYGIVTVGTAYIILEW